MKRSYRNRFAPRRPAPPSSSMGYPYDPYNNITYRKSFTDARGKTSIDEFNQTTGALLSVTYADGTSFSWTYSDATTPIFVTSYTDARGYLTYYDRDAKNRIWRTRYPDGGWETFTYNNFGQVLEHRLTNGGTERFTNAENKTTYYEYRSDDRLWRTTDARGKNEWLWYDQAGRVIELKHDDQTTVVSSYNADGTVAAVTDELGHTTSYNYDEYKRRLTVTNPLGQTITSSYAPWNGSGSLSHTTRFVFRQTSPTGKIVDQDADPNFRPFIKREAPFTADDAMTWYEYDPAGNLVRQQDPRGNVTWFGYDDRNRPVTVTDPLNQTTTTEYDAANNKRREIRPDGVSRWWEYDQMNRVIQTYGFANEGTAYLHDAAGNVTHMIDAKGAWYDFGYDYLNRKTWAQYPPDVSNLQRFETWHFDNAGNLDEYRNPAGQFKRFGYDTRNRQTDVWWDWSVGPSVHTDYDAASRVLRIATNNNETVLAYGYDDANRQVWEDQSLAGYPTRRGNERGRFRVLTDWGWLAGYEHASSVAG